MPYRLRIEDQTGRLWDEDFDTQDQAARRLVELDDDESGAVGEPVEIQFKEIELDLIREAIVFALEQDPQEEKFGAVMRGTLRELADRC